jgi:anaerobic magnesium-protoporphyrin IX monomethyl ester cyclase
MRLLLLSGLGPEHVNAGVLEGTLLQGTIFGREVPPQLNATYARLAGRPVDLKAFRFGDEYGSTLLRPSRGKTPHLPTATLRSILDLADIDYEWFDTENIWSGTGEPTGDFDVVAFSTTFIWDSATLQRTVRWAKERFPAATLVLGGQYSNLKYVEILSSHPEVDYVVRGDAEHALPLLLDALAGKGELSDVPNLSLRKPNGELHTPPRTYVDIEHHPSPSFRGTQPVVPYESMRGCPFTCKFCAFPAASPQWRYKSAEKIIRDWGGYAETNGAQVIKSMDSVFTIPPARFRQLLDLLPSLGVSWEGYSRANVIDTRETVQLLEASHCRFLFIGFEAMNETALKNMSKHVSVKQNFRAVEALRGTSIDVRASFLVGYPGEKPEDYERTHRFVVDDFHGRFNVNTFIFQDETMPVWGDAPIYDLDVTNPWTWKHCGMDSKTAFGLRDRTLREARWQNEHAVHELWQLWHLRPLIPELDLRANYRVEKLIERLAYLVRDRGEDENAAGLCRAMLDELESLGVWTGSPREERVPAHAGV